MDRENTLKKYVGDMIAVEREVKSALEGQLKDKHVQQYPEAKAFLERAISRMDGHIERLKVHADSEGPAAMVKEAAGAVVGMLASVYGKVRSEEVSKMLRDDYVALNVCAVANTMLHTTGLAMQDQAVADAALANLEDYPALIMEVNFLIPSIVVSELRNDGAIETTSAAEQAKANLQAVWEHSTV